MFAAFNKIGYDAIELGNHEFNFGLDYLKKAIGKNKNVLGANVIDDKTGKTWSAVRPYIIKTVKIDGEKVKVGIVGTEGRLGSVGAARLFHVTLIVGGA